MNVRLLVALLAMLFVAGCTSSVRDYAQRESRLDLQDYFDGPLVAWGIVQNRSGEMTRSFRVDLVGRRDGDTGLLEEDFTWSDGQLERRVWTFRKLDVRIGEVTLFFRKTGPRLP